MLSGLFWNIIAPAAIVGAPLFWLVSWIWAFSKADQFVHSKLDSKPRAATPEELAAARADDKKMLSDVMAAYHH